MLKIHTSYIYLSILSLLYDDILPMSLNVHWLNFYETILFDKKILYTRLGRFGILDFDVFDSSQ